MRLCNLVFRLSSLSTKPAVTFLASEHRGSIANLPNYNCLVMRQARTINSAEDENRACELGAVLINTMSTVFRQWQPHWSCLHC